MSLNSNVHRPPRTLLHADSLCGGKREHSAGNHTRVIKRLHSRHQQLDDTTALQGDGQGPAGAARGLAGDERGCNCSEIVRGKVGLRSAPRSGQREEGNARGCEYEAERRINRRDKRPAMCVCLCVCVRALAS